jgi:hypothetical protein
MKELADGDAEVRDEYALPSSASLMLTNVDGTLFQQILIWFFVCVQISLCTHRQSSVVISSFQGFTNVWPRQHHELSPLPQSCVLPSVAHGVDPVQHALSVLSQQYLDPVVVSRAQAPRGSHSKGISGHWKFV